MDHNQSPFKAIHEYLTGKRLSENLKITFPKSSHAPFYKIPLLEKIVKNKKVIHLGCCDHIEVIDAKIKKNIWLHERLIKVTQKCFGIDINSDGIQYLKTKHHIDNICHANIVEDDIPEIQNERWDFILIGELLEHLDQPQLFLRKLQEKYSENVREMIITVPNAFYLRNFVHALMRYEISNSDHRTWFSPYTLARNLSQVGIEIENIYFVQAIQISKPFFLAKLFLSIFPALRSTLVVTAKINQK